MAAANWTRMVSSVSREKAHTQTRKKRGLTRKKGPESEFDVDKEEDKPEVKDISDAMEHSDGEARARRPSEEARAQRPREEADEHRSRPRRDDAAPAAAQGEGGPARRRQDKGGNAAPAAEDAARGRRETKTEREVRLP